MTRRGLGALACALALWGCEDLPKDGPRLTQVSPDSALEGQPVEVVISGEGLSARVFTDFGDQRESLVQPTFQARLGSTSLRQVRLSEKGELLAQVPEGLSAGTYELTVIDPWERVSTLPQAFRVVSEAELDELVAGFRFEPVDAQHVFVPFQVQLSAVDAQGQVVTAFSRSVLLTDETGTVVPKAAGDFASGRWAGRVEVRSAHAQNVLTVRDAAGRTGQSNPFAVATRQPASLRFVTPERTAAADTCSAAVTVELLDPIGTPSPATSPVPVTLTPAPSAGFTLFRDAACATPLDAPAVDRGTSRLSFHFKGTRAGKVTLEAASSGLRSAFQVETIVATATVKLGFANLPLTVKAGDCSGELRIEPQDVFGNATRLLADGTVSLSASPATGLGFFQDASCTTAVSQLTIAAGQGLATAHFKPTVAGPVQLTASLAGLSDGKQEQLVTPAAVATLAFVSAPQAQLVGACSTPMRLQTQDVFGNRSPVSAEVQVALSVAPTTGLALFADGTCQPSPLTSVTVAAQGAEAFFHYQGSSAGSYAVTAQAAGLAPATQVAIVGVPPADRLAFVSAPQTLVAGDCSALVTVESRDLNDAPRPVGAATPVTLTGSAGTSFFSDANCASSIGALTLAAGSTQQSFFFKSTTAGTATLTALVSSWQPASQSATITPQRTDRLAFVSSSRTVQVGDCSPPVTVGVQDVFGNLSPVTAPTVVAFSAAPATGFALFDDANCVSAVSTVTIAASASTATVHFKSTKAALVTLTASAAGLGVTNQAQTVNPQVPDQLVFLTAPRTVTAGQCSGVLTVQAQDALGNPSVVSASGALTLFATPPAGLSFHADGSCTQAAPATFPAGADTVSFYFRSTRADGVQLSASAFGWSAAQAATINPGPTSAFAFEAVTSPKPKVVPFFVRVRAQDVFGNLTSSFAGTATLGLSPTGTARCAAFCTSTTETSAFAGGLWQGEVAVDAASGPGYRLVASAQSLTGTSNGFELSASPSASLPRARLTASPAAVLAGGTITFDASGSFDLQSPSSALTASFDFTGTAAGNPPWTAFGALTAAQTFTIPGVYAVRVAVRDGDGHLGYASTRVAVVAAPSELCTVTAAAAPDDGATDCATGPGPDGLLSLAEAVRLANAGSGKVITFAGPTHVGPGSSLLLGAPQSLLGGKGVVLERALDVAANVTVAGLELRGGAAASTVRAGARLTLVDATLRDFGGLTVRGAATLEAVRFLRCAGDCLVDEQSTSLTLSQSEFLGLGTGRALVVATCGTGSPPLEVSSTVFVGFAVAVKQECPRSTAITHCTFDGNGVGIDYASGTGHVLRNNVFTQHRQAAVSCGAATFATRDGALVFGNVSDGCLAGDVGTLAQDPLYAYRSGQDFCLQATSPAVDSATDLGKDVNGPGPGSYFGAAPDRGAKESW